MKRKNKVRELREANAWSKSELAKKANIVYQTVSKMENGENTSRNSELKVAKVFNMKHEEIFK